MKKLLLLIVTAIILIIYAGIRYYSIPTSLEKGLIYEEANNNSFDILPPMKVMTYNIHRGMNKANELNLDAISEVIENSGAEIIALQEVERFSLRTKFQDQIKYIADKLSMHYAFGKSVNILNGQYGNAILSKYTIEEYEVAQLPSKGERRTLLKAKLNMHGYSINFYNTHLGLNGNERELQLKEIIKLIGNDNRFILAGDFNTKADKLSVITEELIDSASYENNESNPTFEKEGLSERIDYVFISRSFSVKEYKVLKSEASDHYPVVSVIKLLK
jgi:endonuclease/exonuclease/phosphatase family metal-dependent hydrolase